MGVRVCRSLFDLLWFVMFFVVDVLCVIRSLFILPYFVIQSVVAFCCVWAVLSRHFVVAFELLSVCQFRHIPCVLLLVERS